MPTASTESVEKKGPVEVQTPIKQAIAIVEKKVRNLEKRKNKLDLIKQKAASGHQLEADQRNAIEHYNEVIQTLEYSRQLQKQFAAIQTEASKMMKKQARRDKLDRQIHEMKRIEELLKVQNLLDSMGSQTVRADFQTGKHGAVVLTEENLNQLDQLYQLISPTREGDGEYHKKVNTAAEHIVCLLEGKQKEVIGTTYKDLKELVDLISGCGYFETVKTIENEKKSTEISEGADDDQFEGSADVVSSEDDKTESHHDETPLDIPPMTQAPPEHREQQPAPQPARMTAGAPTQPDSNTFYANANANEIYPTPCQRPIDEIVSSVQGSFNFLQESTIDVDSAPHIDPAVVAAQPMSRQSSQQQQQQDAEPTRPISGFGSQVYDRQTDPSQPTQHTSLGHGDQRYPQQPEQGLAYTTSSSSSQQQQQPFRQSLPSKSWASQVEDHELLPDAAIAQFESIPPSIPLPQTQDNQQSNNSNQSEKKFTMNVSAPAFQSMYTQQSQDHVDEESGNGTQSTDPAGANYQNNRYQNDGFQQRGSRREGGGFRGRGGRGGAGNSGGNSNNGGGMQNGFNRNSGTGSGQNSGRGGRGSYQGFPPRSGNFQGDGYQGYSNSGGSGGFGQSYKQRGAGGGTNPGQARGGSGGGARGTGGIRGGGAQRGGNSNAPRSGAPRGGSGGGNNNNSSSSSGAGFSRHGTAQHLP